MFIFDLVWKAYKNFLKRGEYPLGFFEWDFTENSSLICRKCGKTLGIFTYMSFDLTHKQCGECHRVLSIKHIDLVRIRRIFHTICDRCHDKNKGLGLEVIKLIFRRNACLSKS